MRDGKKTVCEHKDGTGTTGQAVKREKDGKGTGSGAVNTRDGNKTRYGGMVDGGNRNQGRERSGSRGRERMSNGFPFPFPSRPVPFPFPTTFSRPDLYRAYPCFFAVAQRKTASLQPALREMEFDGCGTSKLSRKWGPWRSGRLF